MKPQTRICTLSGLLWLQGVLLGFAASNLNPSELLDSFVAIACCAFWSGYTGWMVGKTIWRYVPVAMLMFNASASAATFAWNASTTPGATNVLYLSRSPLTNLATAQWRYDMGARTNATATLDAGTWYVAVTARLDIESEPALLAVIVPQPVTMLRGNLTTEANAQPDHEERGPKQLRAGGQVPTAGRVAPIPAGYSSPFPAAGCVTDGMLPPYLAEKAGRSVRSNQVSRVRRVEMGHSRQRTR